MSLRNLFSLNLLKFLVLIIFGGSLGVFPERFAYIKSWSDMPMGHVQLNLTRSFRVLELLVILVGVSMILHMLNCSSMFFILIPSRYVLPSCLFWSKLHLTSPRSTLFACFIHIFSSAFGNSVKKLVLFGGRYCVDYSD